MATLQPDEIMQELEQCTEYYIKCNERSLNVSLEEQCLGLHSCNYRIKDIILQFTEQVIQDPGWPEVLDKVERLRSKVQNLSQEIHQELESQEENHMRSAETEHTGAVGRPSLLLRKEQVESMRASGYSWTTIASELGVSDSTLHRRRLNWDIPDLYTTVCDDDLDELLKCIKEENGDNLGVGMLEGHLRSRGIILSNARRRIWQSLTRFDSYGTSLRWNRALHRRKYKVPGPNSLWHMDGNHKLKRWGFIIHGAIDGFSRYVVMLGLSTDNTAARVLELFKEAINTHGVPSRLRTDHGTENVLAGQLLLEIRGERSWLCGKSVHNQRIERLWRDVRSAALDMFIQIFHELEQHGDLEPSNSLDIYCLHFVYKPRIISSLKQFTESWNEHGLRTEHYKTPTQLFHSEFVQREDDISQSYGIENVAGLLEMEDNAEDVNSVQMISRNEVENVSELLRGINPMDNDGNRGRTQYLRVRNIVHTYFEH